MELKVYQQQALETLDRYLEELKKARQQVEEFAAVDLSTLPLVLREQSAALTSAVAGFPRAAWENLHEKSGLPGVPDENGENHIPEYITRETASGEPIPHVCLKVPTGGEKTLLGVEAVRRLKIGTGFLLWIVPTKAIYSQTRDAFRNQEHPYRQILDRASGDRVKLLEKSDRWTKQDVQNHLCVMLLMLPSANREKNKEFLKIFRDSSGYDSFFPIAVVRVDRTGKKQRDGIKVHALDARDELIKELGVPEEHIKIKSSEQDELAGVDLLSPFCPVRYIITKDALKEGWDCPFAYQLALLDNTTAKTAMTQLRKTAE